MHLIKLKIGYYCAHATMGIQAPAAIPIVQQPTRVIHTAIQVPMITPPVVQSARAIFY